MVDQTPPTCGGVGPFRKRADLTLDSQCKAPVPLIETSFYDACWEASFEEWPYPDLPYSQSPNTTQYLYGPGTFNITTSATDLSGNTGECFWEIVTADVTGPGLSCPDELSVTGLVPDFSDYVNATDNCGDVTYNQSIAISSLISGTHNVTVTVSDLSGNSASCEIPVSFQAPTIDDIDCPSQTTYNATRNASCIALVPKLSWLEPSGFFSVSQSPAVGQLLSVGDTTITVTVTDTLNQSKICSFVVSAPDTVSPLLTCQDMSTNSSQVPNVTAFVTYSDSCGDVTLVQSPAAGEKLVSGNITVTVTDMSGNSVKCQIQVEREDGSEVPIVIPPPSGSSSDGGLSPGAIAGIVIGVLVGLCLLFGLAAFLLVKRRKRPDDNFFTVELVPATGDVAKSTGHFKAKN